MFKRALAHQSNATPIRSSDRRKLVKDVFARYDFLPADADEDVQRELGRLIMPEGIRVSNMQTSGGIDGALYLSPDNGDPLWMAFGKGSKDLIPSLYTLTLPIPQPPLPLIKLHHPVPPPLFTGAPLFIGAVRNLARPWLLPDVAEGEIVAFVSAPAGDSSDQVQYVGVGRMVAKGGMKGALERRVEAIKSDEDVDEGRFCDILCIHGDFLWEMGSKPELPLFEMPPPRKPLCPPPGSSPSSLTVHAADTSSPADPEEPTHTLEAAAASLTVSDTSTPPAVATSTTEPLSPSEISTLLTLALLQSLSTLEPSQFPMPASTLYSAHILPNRPAYIPKEQREDVVVGKSEWKKVSKWFKEVGKEGLVKVKETKGEVTVVSFDPSHTAIDGHKIFLTIAEDDARSAKRAAKQAAQADEAAPGGATAGKGAAHAMSVEELWKPSGHGVAFWEACGLDTTSLYPVPALKSTLEQYITDHNLPDPRNQRLVRLDETLADAVKARGIDKLSREELVVRLRAGVSWSVSINGQIKKGAMQPITLAVKTRQGRKVVTVITGLETYGIKVDEFAEDLKRICAGSASTQPLQGASPKLNLQEVTVQGNQIKAVTETLVERGVPKRCIKELEGDKKKK